MKNDVVIIGGGLSGLTAAALLSRKNRKVVVLEQHNTVGGLAAGFVRKGYYFDAGMSRVNYSTIMDPLGDLGILKKSDLKPQRISWNIKGRYIEFRDVGAFFKGLENVFPEETSSLAAFYKHEVRRIERVFEAMMPDTFEKRSIPEKAADMFVLLSAMPEFIRGMSSKTLANEVLGKYFDKNGEVYSFLSVKEDELNYRGQMGMVMLTGKLYTQLLNVYPSCGFQGIADRLSAYITARGGIVRNSVKVTQILSENGICTGVRAVAGGKEEYIPASCVITAIDLKKSVFNLTGSEHFGQEFLEKLASSRNTSPIPIMFLGLNIPGERIRECFHGNEELYCQPAVKLTPSGTDDERFYEDSFMVIHSSCLHNQLHAPDNKSNLQIYLQSPRKGWLNNWGIIGGKKTDEYLRIKKMVIEQVLKNLEGVIPDIKDRSVIEVCELGTPYTIERYTGNTDGSGCGFTMDEFHIGQKRPGRFFDSCPGIKGLYFTGHQTGFPGAAGTALASAKHIASKLTKQV